MKIGDEEVKIGSHVWLKSGGPRMTVSAIDHVASSDLNNVECKWFDETDALHEGRFHPDMLVATCSDE